MLHALFMASAIQCVARLQANNILRTAAPQRLITCNMTCSFVPNMQPFLEMFSLNGLYVTLQ